MKLKNILPWVLVAATLLVAPSLAAQQRPSMYGDAVKADVKLNYVYSLEEALAKAKAEKKLIFFNAFADWAVPCHAMNKYVFSDADFAAYMNKTFVNLFIDVTERDNDHIAKRYDISTFAHYLILDANGEVVHRIVGGDQLPAFKQKVMMALSPKTSLQGTEKAYQSGKRDKKSLLAYLNALNLTDDREKFNQIATQYLALVKKADYSKKENWLFVSKLITEPGSDLYEQLVAEKEKFVKNNGEKAVNSLIENLYYSEVAGMAGGSVPYNAARLMDIRLAMVKADLPDTCLTYALYDIAKLRGEHKYDQLLQHLRQNGHKLGGQRMALDMTLDLPDMTEAERTAVVAYLREVAASASKTDAAHLNRLAARIEHNEGIVFETGSFNDALAKAKREGKLVFLDAYTSWCGPCKMMSRDVFPRADVGAVFAPRYVSIKIDMEKGEGVELAKRYNISAFPTMLILDPDGKEIKRIVGALAPLELIKAVTNLDEAAE